MSVWLNEVTMYGDKAELITVQQNLNNLINTSNISVLMMDIAEFIKSKGINNKYLDTLTGFYTIEPAFISNVFYCYDDELFTLEDNRTFYIRIFMINSIKIKPLLWGLFIKSLGLKTVKFNYLLENNEACEVYNGYGRVSKDYQMYVDAYADDNFDMFDDSPISHFGIKYYTKDELLKY